MNNQRVGSLEWTGLAVAGAALVLSAVAFAAPGPSTQAEGTLAAVEPAAVTVTTSAGTQVRVAVTGDTVVIRRRAVVLEEMKPNDFVGVTARREADGSLTAISINIFPPEFRGRVREAQFVMDTGNIMTNAMVFQNVRAVLGRTLYLKLGDGSVIIAVPRDAQVFRLTIMPVGELRPGMRVVVRGTAGSDGTPVAVTITVDAQ